MLYKLAALLFAVALAITLTSCGGHNGKSAQNLLIIAPNQSSDGGSTGDGTGTDNESAGPLPDVNALDEVIDAPRWVSQELRLVSLGTSALDEGLVSTNGTSPDNITSSGTELTLRAFAKGEYAYAVYAQAIDPAVKPLRTQVICRATNFSANNTTPIALSYYIGLADYTIGAWRWFGPYTAENAQVEVNSEILKSRFVSPGAFFYACVLAAPEQKSTAALPLGGFIGELPFSADKRSASQASANPGGVTIEQVETWTAEGLATAPAMVTGLSAAASGAVVSLTWDANVDADVDIYEVWRDDRDDSTPSEIISSVDAPYTHYYDSVALGGKEYRFSVRAHNPSGYSGFSFVDALKPVYIVNFIASYNAEPSIHIEWYGYPGILSYKLYRANSPSDTPELLAELDGSDSSYNDADVPMEAWRYYWIKGYGEDAEGELYGPANGARFRNPVEWAQTWESNTWDYADGIAVDGDGNIFVVGHTYAPGEQKYDVTILKFGADGALLWARGWGGTKDDKPGGVTVDAAGNAYVTGSTGSYAAGGWDLFVMKCDPDGNILWQKTWGGMLNDYGYGIATDGTSSIYVAGETRSFGAGKGDALLLMYDLEGNLNWQKTWGGALEEAGYAVTYANSYLYWGGETDSYGNGSHDMFVLKLYPDGNKVWERVWGSADYERCSAIAVDGNDNVLLAGGDPYSGFGRYASVVKYDPYGSLRFQVGYTGTYEAGGICVDAEGNSYVSAYSWPGINILKFSPVGKLLSAKALGTGIGTLSDGTAMSPDGSVVTCGNTMVFPLTPYYLHDSAFLMNAYDTPTVGTVTAPAGIETTPSDAGYTPSGSIGGQIGILVAKMDAARI